MPTQSRTYDKLALGGYVILTIVLAWPLPMHLATHVLGPWRTDNYEYLWKMWWVPEAIFRRNVSPFFIPDIYYPHGYKLAYGEITPGHTFLLAPLTLALGPIVAYNLANLVSISLSGWLLYLMARRWLSNLATPQLAAMAAFVAGTAFTFSGYRMHRISGHLPLIDTHWVVLAVLGLDSWLDTRRWRDACLTALGISLATLSSWYYALLLVFILPVYVLARTGNPFTLLRDQRSWLAAGLVIGITAVVCVPFLIPYLTVAEEGEMTVPLQDAAFWAASPTDYLMPNPRHPLWGDTIQPLMWPVQWAGEMPVEFAVTSGLPMLFFGTWAWRKVQGPRWRALKWITLTAFVLSLGPYLKLGRFSLGIPLPALALREIAPFATSVRSWGRFSLIVTMGMCILASAGIALALHTSSPKAQKRVIAILLLLVLFTTWIGPWELIRVEARPVDAWLANQPSHSVLMQYPIGEALSGSSVFYTRTHQQPIVFGYGTYFPFLFRDRHPELLDFPADAALDRLAEWGVRYILINTEALDALPDQSAEKFSLAAVDAQHRLRYVITLDTERVYELIN
ncbi:MAG: hypothetical protein JW966_03525 [Anaerolineae bacterium]|nr:hypothetical protein [Anaerolineae bacterium]